MAIVTIFKRNIENALISGLEDTVREFDALFLGAIQSLLYLWPNETVRDNEIASSPRNIVDTGAFRDSQEFVYINPFLAEFSWGDAVVDYAPQVFFGFTTAGGIVYPARNPVQTTLDSVDATGLFATNVRRYAS